MRQCTTAEPFKRPPPVGAAAVSLEPVANLHPLCIQTPAPSHRSYAKGFGAMGALFAGSECVIEKARAKHDRWNSIYAGCTAGAVLAHSGGPKAMALGCGTFAAFSAAIDHFMDH